jgi:hypothetical protein
MNDFVLLTHVLGWTLIHFFWQGHSRVVNTGLA